MGSLQIEICASLNHRKKTKADGSQLIPRKHTETLVLLSINIGYLPFLTHTRFAEGSSTFPILR